MDRLGSPHPKKLCMGFTVILKVRPSIKFESMKTLLTSFNHGNACNSFKTYPPTKCIGKTIPTLKFHTSSVVDVWAPCAVHQVGTYHQGLFA